MVPRVIAMLNDPDPDVVMEAIGVLVAQKDERAVVPLIRMTQGRDRIFLLQIITAVGEIRGPTARGFLFTLAAGHTSPEIRKRAQETLDRLLREQKSSGTGSDQQVLALPENISTRKDPRQKGGS